MNIMAITETQKAYNRSEKGKAAHAKYNQSEKGKAAHARHLAKRKAAREAKKAAKTDK